MKKLLLIVTLVLFLVIGNVPMNHAQQVTTTPQKQFTSIPDFCLTISDPSNVCIVEGVQYFRAVGNERPKAIFWGFLYWEFIAGNTLSFFLNVSDIIGTPKVYDPLTPNNPSAVSWQPSKANDSLSITPNDKQFAYQIEAYYNPDVVKDTGFIVVFQSQVVNFPLPGNNGTSWYKVDYSNTIILPQGAGIVSYAPTDGSLQSLNPAVLHWEYRNRAMDSKHDPLITEVTYSFDQIYLQFNQLILQNIQQQQKQQNDKNRLDFLNSAFQIISTLAIVASLFSVLIAYLLAKRRYQKQKDQARQLPKRQAIDVEHDHKVEIEVKKLLLGFFFIFLLLSPAFLAPTNAQQNIPEKRINWYGQYEIFENNSIHLTIKLQIPTKQNIMKIWVNTSNIWNFKALDQYGVPLGNIQKYPDRMQIDNPPLYVQYSYSYNFVPYNYSGMLVFIDRFWLEYRIPNPTSTSGQFYHANIDYNVVLPSRAIIYSASPSKLLNLTRDPDGRHRIRFVDTNRAIDAFHDAWETQVSYSFVNVLDAIENLNVKFFQYKVKQQNINDIIRSAQDQVLIFAILGLIAPLLSFLFAYWVFRRRNLKEIERIQQQQEELMLVEPVQIQAFKDTSDTSNENRDLQAYLGYYWQLIETLRSVFKKDVLHLDSKQLETEIIKHKLQAVAIDIMNLVSEGRIIEESEEPISSETFIDYATRVNNLLKEIEERRT